MRLVAHILSSLNYLPTVRPLDLPPPDGFPVMLGQPITAIESLTLAQTLMPGGLYGRFKYHG
jgi:hypothetical protein